MVGVWVSLIDDDDETRRVYRELLAPGGWRCREHATLTAAVEALGRGEIGEVALVDLDFDGATAFSLVERIVAERPQTRVIALTAHGGDDWLFPALAAGCLGFVLKSEAVRRLPEVVAQALAGDAPLTGSVARRVLARFHRQPDSAQRPLSPRETEVLTLLAQGLTYQQAAERLEVSLSTLRTHAQRVYEKLRITSKAQAAGEAIRRGLLR